MITTHTVAGEPGGEEHGDAHYAILVSRYNDAIVESLANGAIETLSTNGVANANITLVRVPGAYELPLAAKKLADSGDYAAIIALGAVIRGETSHFQYVAGECVRGLAEVSLSSEVPVLLGVLTTETVEQAAARAAPRADISSDALKQSASGKKQGNSNKGAEAALAALEMVSLLQVKLPQEKGLRDQAKRARMLKGRGKRY